MRKINSQTHVFSAHFDHICVFFGPGAEGNKNVGKILGRAASTVQAWRSGLSPVPRWSYELLRLTAEERRRQIREMTGQYRSSRRFLLADCRLSNSLVDVYGTRSANDGFQLVDLSRGATAGADE